MAKITSNMLGQATQGVGCVARQVANLVLTEIGSRGYLRGMKSLIESDTREGQKRHRTISLFPEYFSLSLASRWKLGIIFLVLIGAISIILFRSHQFDLQTNNWKVYRNEERGFEFRYPMNYILLEKDGRHTAETVVQDIVNRRAFRVKLSSGESYADASIFQSLILVDWHIARVVSSGSLGGDYEEIKLSRHGKYYTFSGYWEVPRDILRTFRFLP